MAENLNIIRKYALGILKVIRGRKEDEFKEEKIFTKLQYWRIYRKDISFMKKRK